MKGSVHGECSRIPNFVAMTSAIRKISDDMYFGDSQYSIGIQLADLCSYFIARHLDGDAEIKGFYEMIDPHIVFRGLVDTYRPHLSA
jgi:hypothetical protein